MWRTEGVADQTAGWLALVFSDGNDVESVGCVVEFVFGDVGFGRADDALLFGVAYRGLRWVGSSAGFHFDEDQNFFFPGDQIHFTFADAEAGRDYLVALIAQVFGCLDF